MAKVLIDIPDEVYERLFTMKPMDLADNIAIDMAIKHGIVLDGLTNGEVIKAIFPDATITQKNEYVVFLEIDRYGEPKLFDTTWWNRKWGE